MGPYDCNASSAVLATWSAGMLKVSTIISINGSGQLTRHDQWRPWRTEEHLGHLLTVSGGRKRSRRHEHGMLLRIDAKLSVELTASNEDERHYDTTRDNKGTVCCQIRFIASQSSTNPFLIGHLDPSSGGIRNMIGQEGGSQGAHCRSQRPRTEMASSPTSKSFPFGLEKQCKIRKRECKEKMSTQRRRRQKRRARSS